MFSDNTMGFQINEGHHQFFAVKGADAGSVKDLFFGLFINDKKRHRVWVPPIL
jgi:hypothetical protein